MTTEPAYTVAPPTAVRRAMAARMQQSNTEVPQVTLQAEADADALVRAVEAAGGGATVTSYLLAIVARTLVDHAVINSWRVEGERRLVGTVNLGVAVASRHGLVVPVVHGAESLTVTELGTRLVALREAADARTLQRSDISHGTFTVTNLGMFGVGHFNPLVNPPQVAILGVGAVAARPVLLPDGGVGERRYLPLSLTFDHAAVDGAEAALFLRDLRRAVERAVLEPPGHAEGAAS